MATWQLPAWLPWHQNLVSTSFRSLRLKSTEVLSLLTT